MTNRNNHLALCTYHDRGRPSPSGVLRLTMSSIPKMWRHDAPQWQRSSAHVSGIAREGVSSDLVAPQGGFHSRRGRMTVPVESAESWSRPRARIRCHPARQHARINTLEMDWPQVGNTQEERTIVDIIKFFCSFLHCSHLPPTPPSLSHRSHVYLSTMLHIGVPSCSTPWCQLFTNPSLVAARDRFQKRSHYRQPAAQAAAATSTLCATPSASPVLTFLPVLAMVASTFS